MSEGEAAAPVKIILTARLRHWAGVILHIPFRLIKDKLIIQS
jgi:hypothetical protein